MKSVKKQMKIRWRFENDRIKTPSKVKSRLPPRFLRSLSPSPPLASRPRPRPRLPAPRRLPEPPFHLAPPCAASLPPRAASLSLCVASPLPQLNGSRPHRTPLNRLMIFPVARTKRSFCESWGAFTLPLALINGLCYSRTVSTMREVKTCGVSGSIADISDGESHIQKSVLWIQDQRSLSSSTQCTPEIEKKYVHSVYDAIAPHFSSTRFAKWPKVATFLKSLPLGSIVLDAGCGNGKYLGLNPDCFFIGCDISAPLVNICSDRGHEVVVADAVNLPYRTGFGDAAISIAVLHHLSTESRRKKAIHELVRSVKEGGLVLITVWAVEQEDGSLVTKWTPLTEKYLEEWIGPSSPRVRTSPSSTLESIPETEEKCSQEHLKDSKEIPNEKLLKNVHVTSISEDNSVSCKDKKHSENQQEYFVPWHLPYHRAEVSGASASALANGLAKKDDKKGAVVYNRYYHVFSEGELEGLVSGMENAVIVDRFYDKSNWCIVLERTS